MNMLITHENAMLIQTYLDFFIMAYVCACYFMNYLDRQAFANAYVSHHSPLDVAMMLRLCACRLMRKQVAGLKEDLQLKGNEYSFLLSLYTAG
jgi:ACS family pantothenate transporter-like MFS transporter